MKQGTIAAVAAATAALALPGAAQAAEYQDAVMADGPLSYWRLDETSGTVAQDATANDRDGTFTNAALGAASPFLGAGTAVTLPKTGSIAGTVAASSGSVELWLNATKLKKGEQAGIAAHGDPAGDGWALGIGAKRKVAWKHAGATSQSKVTLPTGIWTQVAVTWDGSKVRIYVNGNITKTVNGSAPASSNGAFVVGGNGAGAFTGALAGKVDEVALYQQVLTAQDIKDHFGAAHVPVNTALPTITGTLQVGQTLTVHGGTWTNAGASVPAYQWQRCDKDGNDCDDVAGATGTTYLLADADNCGTLQVIETITNASGTGAAISDPTGVVGSGCGATDPGTGTGGDPGTGTGGDPGTGTGGDPGTGTGGDPGTGTGTARVGRRRRRRAPGRVPPPAEQDHAQAPPCRQAARPHRNAGLHRRLDQGRPQGQAQEGRGQARQGEVPPRRQEGARAQGQEVRGACEGDPPHRRQAPPGGPREDARRPGPDLQGPPQARLASRKDPTRPGSAGHTGGTRCARRHRDPGYSLERRIRQT